VAGFALAPAAALADTATSSNWAGYAVHRGNVRFTRAGGAWRQPKVTCTRGNPTYSAVWVGIGGFDLASEALEQIGTEVDCTPSGHVSSSAWYELVPAPSETIGLRVRPGDSMSATVTVVGHRVTLALFNHTTRQSFQRTFTASEIDATSAEWIVEAPSDCFSDNSCQTLPLANFGMAAFTQAHAVAVGGRSGSITSAGWGATKITLVPEGRRFVTYGGGTTGTATPSGLSAGGSAFKVNFGTVSLQNPLAARGASVRLIGRLVHPTR
jgi:peptidase A4-like protein